MRQRANKVIDATRAFPSFLESDLIHVLRALVVFQFDRDLGTASRECQKVGHATQDAHAFQLDVVLYRRLAFVGYVENQQLRMRVSDPLGAM